MYLFHFWMTSNWLLLKDYASLKSSDDMAPFTSTVGDFQIFEACVWINNIISLESSVKVCSSDAASE